MPKLTGGRISRVALCAIPLCTAAMAARAEVAAGGSTANETQAPQIAEIVVTAEKHETTLQKVPEAVSVLNGNVQRLRGEEGLEDLQTNAPSVTFASTSDNSQIYIRGVGNTFINAGGDPGVAFYQDGAYVSDQRTINTSFFDDDRVEILRGPQGALYGRNAVGGAVNVISAQPTDTPQGQVDVVGGSYGMFESEGFVSGPLGNSGLDGRLSYQVQGHDGYTRNLLAGQPGAPKSLDGLDSQAIRGQLAANLPGQGRVTLLASYYNQADGGPALSVVPVASFVYPAQALYGDIPSSDPRAVYANVGSEHLQVATVNLKWVQPIGDYTLTTIANYRGGRQYFLNDCDGTPANACTYLTATSSQDLYGETYLASPDHGRLRWTVGATVLNFNQSQIVTVDWQTLLAYLSPGAPSDAPFGISYNGGGHLHTQSEAVYADAHLQLNKVWALTGDIRYNKTTKNVGEFQVIQSFGVNVPSSPNFLRNTSTPFKLRLEGQLTDELLVYASYATASKDGAINIGALQTTPVKPETVRSWELGEKADFFEHRFQLDGALFDSNYDDLQISQVVGTIAALANAPKSEIRGVELEATVLPMRGLTLSANADYLDAHFVQFSNSQTIPGLVSGPLQNLAGNLLPYVPRESVNLDARYRFDVTDRLGGTIDAQYSWRSAVYFNEFNIPSNSVAPGGVVNLSASLGPQSGSWKLYAYVHNILNRTYQTGSTIYSGLLGGEKAVSYAPPRTAAIGVSYKF